MKLTPGVMLVGLAAVLWIVEQNRLYQDKLAKVAAASQPVGNLAATVDRYMPTIVDAWDYWAHK